MAASTGDKITDVRNAARPNSARVSTGRSAGGATLNCDNLAGWPTASKVHFVTYTIDSNSDPVAGTQLDCYGIVSGNDIGSFTVVDGTDTGNSVNDVVEMLPTAAWGQDLADALTSQHSRVGAHKSITNTGGLTTDTITVSGAATLSGGTTLPAGDIVTADIANAAVTASKLSTGAATASVATSETTTSTSYVQLATTTDQVTVTIGANGLALVALYVGQNTNSNAGVTNLVSVAVSGASTVAGDDSYGLVQIGLVGLQVANASTFLLTGLTAGSNTFKMVYRVTANTGTFANRRITVVPL